MLAIIENEKTDTLGSLKYMGETSVGCESWCAAMHAFPAGMRTVTSGRMPMNTDRIAAEAREQIGFVNEQGRMELETG
jgi:hypothetical protein